MPMVLDFKYLTWKKLIKSKSPENFQGSFYFTILQQLPVCCGKRGEVCENNIYVLQVCSNVFCNNVLVVCDKRQVCNMICADHDSSVLNVLDRAHNHVRALSAWAKLDRKQRKRRLRKIPAF